MAIYHLHVGTVSRAKGSSAVAAAAYQSGEALRDLRTGALRDYARKERVVASGVALPDGAPPELADRAALWNAAEAADASASARPARRIECALPRELDRGEREGLCRDWAALLASQGMCADWAMHADAQGRNPHVHALLTTRPLAEGASWDPSRPDGGVWAAKARKIYLVRRDADGDERWAAADELRGGLRAAGYEKVYRYRAEGGGTVGLTKAAGEAAGLERAGRDPVSRMDSATAWDDAATLAAWRASWAELCNRALDAHADRYRLEPAEHIDHRSNEARGIGAVPTRHEGAGPLRDPEAAAWNREARAANAALAAAREAAARWAARARAALEALAARLDAAGRDLRLRGVGFDPAAARAWHAAREAAERGLRACHEEESRIAARWEPKMKSTLRDAREGAEAAARAALEAKEARLGALKAPYAPGADQAEADRVALRRARLIADGTIEPLDEGERAVAARVAELSEMDPGELGRVRAREAQEAFVRRLAAAGGRSSAPAHGAPLVANLTPGEAMGKATCRAADAALEAARGEFAVTDFDAEARETVRAELDALRAGLDREAGPVRERAARLRAELDGMSSDARFSEDASELASARRPLGDSAPRWALEAFVEPAEKALREGRAEDAVGIADRLAGLLALRPGLLRQHVPQPYTPERAWVLSRALRRGLGPAPDPPDADVAAMERAVESAHAPAVAHSYDDDGGYKPGVDGPRPLAPGLGSGTVAAPGLGL